MEKEVEELCMSVRVFPASLFWRNNADKNYKNNLDVCTVVFYFEETVIF